MATASRQRFPHARTDALIGVALVSSVIFVWLIAAPVFGPVKQKIHAGHLPLLYLHIAGGTTMLFAGAIALRIGLTRDWFRWHKPAGYTYITGGSVASTVAIIRSFDTQHTPGIATGALAAVWLAFTAMAFRAIRTPDRPASRVDDPKLRRGVDLRGMPFLVASCTAGASGQRERHDLGDLGPAALFHRDTFAVARREQAQSPPVIGPGLRA